MAQDSHSAPRVIGNSGEDLLMNAYRQIDVERAADVFCVRLRQQRLDESAIHELRQELIALVKQEGCRKLALSLGPESPDCLYSVFLAALVTVRRVLVEHGGTLLLHDVSPDTLGVFQTCQLHDHFQFAADLPAAIAALTK